jgi:hypothetical protein
MIFQINPEKLHHAYFLEGDTEQVLPSLLSFFEKELEIIQNGNPDMRVESYETFGVDEGRELKEAQLSKSFGGGKKIFVISFETITVEAQNSLLKVFEEPTPDTHFFLISRTGSRLLPTLRSRIVFLQTESDSTPSLLQAKKFISSSISERLKLIESITEEKNKKEAKEFLSELATVLRNQKPVEKFSREDSSILQDVLRAHDYLSDRSPSVKMLLEHIAHILPV